MTLRMRRIARDPLVAIAVLLLWLLLGIFILYPLACLLVRAFTDEGGLTLRPLLAVAGDAEVTHVFTTLLLYLRAPGCKRFSKSCPGVRTRN